MQVLTKLWMEFSTIRFPRGYGGKEVNGVCVTYLDSIAVGCVNSYMRKEGNQISVGHHQILYDSKVKLADILKYLDGEALVYFSKLHDICSLITDESTIT
ncbi:hypothetical protein N476_18065 [Pseudoalteromonas luteoviolacea H33]|uniref:Uncharacterized protein n=1 Tax=Pseudoalteromonas luteoviolacea H33 TaxID=1365251 RepID=A0A161Y3Y0_9GAMM|nr:hypothetical protein N476_18065 [Pseudoalteromonas luteoviolacea H33]KZN74825.1 hypothetical protein N477_21480 [Pseudoalteromonas luteoviolacea H33-S]